MILSAVFMDVFNVHLLTSEQKQKARKAVVGLGLRPRRSGGHRGVGTTQFLLYRRFRLGSYNSPVS